MKMLLIIYFFPLTVCGLALWLVVQAAINGATFQLPYLTDAGFRSWVQLVIIIAVLLVIPAAYFGRAFRIPRDVGSSGYSRTFWVTICSSMYACGLVAGLLMTMR